MFGPLIVFVALELLKMFPIFFVEINKKHREENKMKKIATLIMLIMLLIVGYSVGNAIAKNHSNMNNSAADGMNGVYVMEEEYGVVETPMSSDTIMQSDNKNATTSSDTNSTNGVVVEEDIVESGN